MVNSLPVLYLCFFHFSAFHILLVKVISDCCWQWCLWFAFGLELNYWFRNIFSYGIYLSCVFLLSYFFFFFYQNFYTLDSYVEITCHSWQFRWGLLMLFWTLWVVEQHLERTTWKKLKVELCWKARYLESMRCCMLLNAIGKEFPAAAFMFWLY